MNENRLIKTCYPFFFLLFCFAGCADSAKTVPGEIRPAEGIYYDYQVWGEEGRDDVTVRLQYRNGNKDGEAVALVSPSQVMLDGEFLPADSTKFSGTYYEATKPVSAFNGKHTIVYIDHQKKEHQEEFIFTPFSLVEELPENIKMRPFHVRLQGISQSATPIRLVMTDTSMQSADVNEELIIEGGIIAITEENLRNLTKGPVTLEIYLEEERPIKVGAAFSGKFIMTYGLRRQFLLQE